MKAKQDSDADVSGLLQAWTAGNVEARDRPRWTPENRPLVDGLKPATTGMVTETS